jgi:glycosyltransferase involved in cell wall biosynthesis
MTPPIGVVIPTYNRASRLPRLIACLEAQRGIDSFDVTIVDDASTDDTWTVLRRLAARSALDLRCERLDRNRGPAAARNVGWRSTSAPVVAFTDDDCMPQPDWLARLLAAADTADIVQGRTLPDPDQLARLGPFSRTLDISHDDGYFQTCNIAYRRDVLTDLGGFHEGFRYPAGEDTDLAWRAKESGATSRFDDGAVVHHDVRRSDFRVAIRDSWRWQSTALAASRHPRLRESFASPHVWRVSHRHLLTAALGGVVLGARPRSRATWLAGAALIAPYVRYRTVTAPLPGAGPRRRWLLLPAAAAVDGAELVACLVGSVRHRALVI